LRRLLDPVAHPSLCVEFILSRDVPSPISALMTISSYSARLRQTLAPPPPSPFLPIFRLTFYVFTFYPTLFRSFPFVLTFGIFARGSSFPPVSGQSCRRVFSFCPPPQVLFPRWCLTLLLSPRPKSPPFGPLPCAPLSSFFPGLIKFDMGHHPCCFQPAFPFNGPLPPLLRSPANSPSFDSQTLLPPPTRPCLSQLTPMGPEIWACFSSYIGRWGPWLAVLSASFLSFFP